LAVNLSKADARWLLLFPLSVAAVLGVLMLPWSAVPEGIPLPTPDARQLARSAEADRAAAATARSQPLPGAVRALGSALRSYHTLEAQQANEGDLGNARSAIDKELPDALRAGEDAVLALRAVELEGFLEEERRFEETGRVSPELEAVAGTFVRSMTNQGWCQGHTMLASATVLRVMFKEMWNGFVGVEGRAAFDPTLDEKRVLYAFYLGHPHPTAGARPQIEALRRGARDARDCANADSIERRSLARWSLERIGRIAAIDADYPADYARGIASYRAEAYDASAAAFRAWLQEHPNGPYALRAQAFLRAALSAGRLD
jgi:hypothetical protein